MAYSKAQTKILQAKLKTITSQKDELHSIIDVYVDNVVAMGRSVIDQHGEEGETKSFEEINSTLEKCLDILAHKYVEIEDLTSESQCLASDSDLSHSTPSPPVSNFSSANTMRTSGTSEMSQLYNRIGAIEMAMATCHSEVQKLTDLQRETKDETENLTQKLDKLQNKTEEEEARQISKYDEMETKINELGVSENKCKKRLNRVEEQLKHMDANQTDTKHKQETRLLNIEDNVKQAEMRLMAEMEEMDSRMMTAVDQNLKDLREKQANLQTINNSRLDDHDRKLEEISSKVNANEKSLITVVSHNEEEEKRMQKLEERIAAGEVKRRKDLRHYSKKMDEVNSSYRQVCLIVDSRVTPLQRLLHILNNLIMNKQGQASQAAGQESQATGQVSQATGHISQAVASPVQEKLTFSALCGWNIQVFNNNKSARKRDAGDWRNSVVMTNRELGVGEMFVIRLDKLIYSPFSFTLCIGVTTYQPSQSDFPYYIGYIKSDTCYMESNQVRHNGSVIVTDYGRDLTTLKKGDCVGIVRKPDGTIHFFVNGTDQGACPVKVPPNVYGIIQLCRAVQATIVDR